MMIRINTNYKADYDKFLEQTVVVADRHKISISDAVQQILFKDGEFEMFLATLEMGGRTMADIAEDCKTTYIYESHEQFYKANGINRDWLGIQTLN